MKIQASSVKQILVVRNDRFGEFLLIIPALRALKNTFPGARLIAVVNPAVRELAEAIPSIDEIIAWERTARHSWSEKARLVGALRKRKIDIAVMLNPSKQFNIFTFLAGIPVRAGYNRKWGFLLTHTLEDKKHLGQKHEIDYNLELVGEIGAGTDDKALVLNTDAFPVGVLAEAGISAGDTLVAIHPWTSDPIKQWDAQNFLGVAERLVQEARVKVVIIGGKAEESAGRELFNTGGGAIINLTGKTTLKQLAALLKRCVLLISGDSGPVHLASAVSVPTLAIFRSDMPGKNSKRWGPSGKGSVVIEKNSLAEITVDEVVRKAREMHPALT